MDPDYFGFVAGMSLFAVWFWFWMVIVV